MVTEIRSRSRSLGQMRATALGVMAILLWASLALLTVSASGIPSFELLALTFGIAFVAGLIVLSVRGRERLAELRQPLAPWLTAFAGIFLYHALYFYALSKAPPAQASLIAYLWPLLIVVLSALSSGQSLQVRYLAGAILGFSGSAVFLLQRNEEAITIDGMTGYIAAFACALVWAGYSVLNRRFKATPSGMIVGICGAVSLAGALCHIQFETTVWPDTYQWIAIAVLGIGPTGIAFLAWDYATKHGNLSLLGALSYLAPLLSTMLLIGTGKADLTGGIVVGAALIIGGALVVSSPDE
jgi:drug/metabolite transporter (DMT)-like permease